MEFAINSKKAGRIVFSRPSSYYIYADLNGKSGTLGNQICEYGCTLGNTLGYSGDSYEEFEMVCRKWYRKYIKNLEE